MFTYRMIAGALLVAMAAATALSAQGLSGTYTIANGNPGSGYDYGDLGTAFDALETQGMAGPVTLELYDVGGPFVSNASYQLGANATTHVPIPGMGATNPLVIRPAPGNSPVISGSGADCRYPSTGLGTLSFDGVQHVTIEGLEITGGGNYGMMWLMWSPSLSLDHITIRRCRIHGITQGAGIFFYNPASAPGASNVTIENNMLWNCFGDAGTGPAFGRVKGVIGAGRSGANWIVRHNTIVHTSGGPDTSVYINIGTGAVAWADFSYNVTYFTHATSSYYRVENTTTTLIPTVVDRNVVYLSGGANMCNNPTYGTWSQWQAAGKDTNGVNADPLLESISAPFDLRITAASPAVDLAVGSPVTEDIFGDTRPISAAPDAGAHEYGLPGAIEVSYNAAPVLNAGSVNIGMVPVGGSAYDFQIDSTGLGDLVITGNVFVTHGANCAAATAVQSQPASTQIPPAGSTLFTVYAESANPGAFDFTVTIPNSDPANNPFVFTVNGAGVNPNGDATAAALAGFALVATNVFEITVSPGVPIPTATIRLSDPDNDDITTTVAAIGTAPTGLSAPANPSGAAPLDLTWTGTPDAANDPGPYEWSVDFNDVGPFATGTIINITVRVIISDLPPNHAILNADGGSGSTADPYTAQYTQGDSAADVVNLCTITDPNTSQGHSITAVNPGANPSGGAGFQFDLTAGVLAVMPAGALQFADAGVHTFDVTVEDDGGNPVDIAVSILVYGTSGNITFTPATLPDAIVDGAYNRTIAVTGATGAVTLSLQGGTLPPGIAFNAAAGTLSGTPTAAGAYTFTIRAEDSAYDTATHQYTLTVKPPKVGGSGSSGGDGGCTAGSSNLPVALALMALLAAAITRRGKGRIST